MPEIGNKRIKTIEELGAFFTDAKEKGAVSEPPEVKEVQKNIQDKKSEVKNYGDTTTLKADSNRKSNQEISIQENASPFTAKKFSTPHKGKKKGRTYTISQELAKWITQTSEINDFNSDSKALEFMLLDYDRLLKQYENE